MTRAAVLSRRDAAALAALVVLAALLRYWDIGDQSYWLDESATVNIVSRSFGDAMATVPRTESTPPLYYALGWLWAQVFGSGEAGLRSLSALFGVATVPAAYLAARELFDGRAGLFAAGLVAVNPWFVWYSQEARAYALLVLLATVSMWLWARALNGPTPTRVASWAAVASLALVTHYFAAFLIVPEALWLLWRLRSRVAALGVGAVALTGLALAPLAHHQSGTGHLHFISESSFASRLAGLPKKFVTGEHGTTLPAVGALALAAAAVGVVALFLRGGPRERRAGIVVLGLAVAAVAVPFVLAVAGFDYFLARNVIAAYVPAILLVGAGFASLGRAGLMPAAVVAIVAVVVTVEVTRSPELQRDDWRAAAGELGPPTQRRAVIVTSEPQVSALELYAGDMRPVPAPAGAAVSEVVTIGNARPPRYSTPPAPPGFQPVSRRRTESWELIRYRAPRPTPVTPGTLAPTRLGAKPPALLLQDP